MIGFLVVSALASCAEPAQHPEQSGPALTPPPPDLLVVVLDTVRADALTAYGNARPTSPQLEALARRGVLFEDVTAPSSWTWPSHASLFTGQPPWIHGAHFVQPTNADHQLYDLSLGAMREDLPTLAGQLSESGYTTVSLAANPMLAPEKGLTRGFDHAAHLPSDLAVLEEAVRVMQEVQGPLFLFVNLFVAHQPAKVTAAPWSQAHLKILKDQAVEPVLLPYVRLDPPGIELYGHPGGSEQSGVDRLRAGEVVLSQASVTLLRDLYEGEVAVADDELTPLVRGWDQWRGDSVIAVTSDHGEYFGEHGLWEHARTLHAPVLEVPLVLVGRGLPAGQRVTAPVELLDLTATLLTLAGLETDDETLLDTVAGVPPGPIRAAAWPDPARMARLGGVYADGWRLYREEALAVLWSADNSQLYDLTADPDMLHDLAGERPQELERLLTVGRTAVPWGEIATGVVPLDGDAIESLRALGYLE